MTLNFQKYKNLYILFLFFVMLLALRFKWLCDPFFGDELIYILRNFEHTSLSSFIPFHPNYISFSGHPQALPFLSFLVYKSGLPFIPAIRLIYLSFSAFFLFSTWKVGEHFIKNLGGLIFLILGIMTNALFFTQSTMSLGNIPECSILLFAIHFHLKKKHDKALLLLFFGLFIRESLIGPIIIFYLIGKNYKKDLKYLLMSICFLVFFYLAEWKGAGTLFNHPWSSKALDHGQFFFSFSNIPLMFDRLFTLIPTENFILLILATIISLKHIKEKRRDAIPLLAICLPYLTFFGLSGDSQGRDYLILLPILLIWGIYLSEHFLARYHGSKLFVIFILIFQLNEFKTIRNKETPHLDLYFKSYQKMLTYLDNNHEVKENLSAEFPFQHIFKDKIYGHLKNHLPISQGKGAYLLSPFRKDLHIVHQIKVHQKSQDTLTIYKNIQ
jgi:hypothetical protein